MNIEPAKGADRAELLDFLFAVFTRGNPTHPRFETFCDDLFEPTDETMGRHLVVREGGRIVSCVGAYPMDLHVAGCRVRFAGIGQVSTAKEALGKGCMSALLKAQLERLRGEGVKLVWLGGRHDRYAHFGFETAGWFWSLWFDSHSLARAPRSRAVAKIGEGPASPVTPAMWELRRRTDPFVDEPFERWRKRLGRIKCEVWTATPAGAAEPDAWAVYSAEHKKLVDYAGAPEGILEIAAETVKIANSLIVAVGASDVGLVGALRPWTGGIGLGMGMLLSLDNAALLDAFAPVFPAGAPLPDPALPSPEFVRAFFGPRADGAPTAPFFLPDLCHV
jgi:predicted N-acetyltransferase YhbS